MKVDINMDNSYVHGNYVVLEVNISADYDSMCVLTLSEAEIKDNGVKSKCPSSRGQGYVTMPIVNNFVDDSFGTEPFPMEAKTSKTNYAVFKLNGTASCRDFTIRNSIKEDDFTCIKIDMKSLSNR